MSYVIMTDSDSELDYPYAKKLDVEMIMMPYTHMGKEQTYCPSYDFNVKKFYNELRSGEMPTTAGLNPFDFIEIWEPILQSDKDILYIGLSSALSNTFDNATIAQKEILEKYPNRTIVLVDSKRISMALGILVLIATELKNNGKTINEVANWIETNKLFVRAWFTVDDLHYLKRGGRLSASSAFFGSILSVKPIITISDDGKLVPVGKIKGRKKALKYMLNEFEKECIDPEKNTVVLCQGDCYDEANSIKIALEENNSYKNFIINPVGPVVGAHVGPGTMGLCYVMKEADLL